MHVALALGTTLQAQLEHWTYLGDAHVNGSVDQDRIKVGRSDGKFRAIQLRVVWRAFFVWEPRLEKTGHATRAR